MTTHRAMLTISAFLLMLAMVPAAQAQNLPSVPSIPGVGQGQGGGSPQPRTGQPAQRGDGSVTLTREEVDQVRTLCRSARDWRLIGVCLRIGGLP